LYVFSTEIAKHLSRQCYSLVLEFNYIASAVLVNIVTLLLIQFNFMNISIPGRVSKILYDLIIRLKGSKFLNCIYNPYAEIFIGFVLVFVQWWYFLCTRSLVFIQKHTCICEEKVFVQTNFLKQSLQYLDT